MSFSEHSFSLDVTWPRHDQRVDNGIKKVGAPFQQLVILDFGEEESHVQIRLATAYRLIALVRLSCQFGSELLSFLFTYQVQQSSLKERYNVKMEKKNQTSKSRRRNH